MAWQPSTNPVTIQRWRDRVDAFERSSLTLPQFCEESGFGYSSMRHWRRWVRDNPPARHALVAVRVEEPPARSDDTQMVVELRQGRRVLLQPGFDQRAVADLVRLLEQA